jgi:hypothetical protein
MAILQNPAIEYPERLFEVEVIVFGTLTRSATRRTLKVLAQTVKGARRICRLRYPRSDILGARAAGEPAAFFQTSLFAAAPHG